MSIAMRPTASRTAAVGTGSPAFDACWPCAERDDGDAAHATEFLDRLCTLPLGSWLTVGARALRTDDDADARAALDRVAAERRLGVPAWYVRDAVATAIELAWCAPDRAPDHPADKHWSIPSHSPAVQRRLDAAREAAERAALAILVRAWLPRATFDVLYAPLADVVPLAG